LHFKRLDTLSRDLQPIAPSSAASRKSGKPSPRSGIAPIAMGLDKLSFMSLLEARRSHAIRNGYMNCKSVSNQLPLVASF